ncbi:hypothetical protein HYQ46_003771 [Verticillium longisporum]|nr:hypothetical protein HYQ46_003771 [Verticillium longisporum]
MPGEDLEEPFLTVTDHGVTMARNDRLKIPLGNATDALAVARSVLGAEQVPLDTPRPLAVAFGRLQVEKQIGLDEDTVGAEVEDEFLVGVSVYKLVIKLGIGEGRLPFGEKDVVLNVRGDDVGDSRAQGGDLGADRKW